MVQRGTTVDTSSDSRDRPVLAPSTWLVGQLQESALEQPPWAVEQPKRGYVEMSELAYRVAEQATGDQTIDQIATAVSTALRRPVSAVDVEALIDTVLIPRGVVRGPYGRTHDDDADAAPATDADPDTAADDAMLADAAGPAASMARGVPSARDPRGRRRRPAPARAARRERIVGPEALEAVASILMWLFWPPVMLVLAGLGLAALVWLFTIHGLARSVIQVLGAPLLLPVTLVVTVLGAAVQRIGPMVALYGGGATIRRLRVRPSLRRPVFEVDVADDYGLSRWARLTVNVSGVYLQLVVALVLCIVGRLVGPECLFLAAALLTLNMIRLLLPFGRPGADRLLADWLLVQHPLRYAEQALERYLPSPHPPARPLPPLKRWGRVTIGAYLLAVAVVLAVVGLVILRTTPTILATLWVALTAHLAGMADALGERDVVGFVGSLVNAAVLLLTTFCLAVALVVVVRGLLVRAWAWSRETPRRRLLGGIGAAALVLLVVLCWVPVRGFGAGGPPRSLAGIPFRSLNELSRGTLFDLFGEPSTVDTSADRPGDRPIVTTDVGSGVGGPLPDAATPSAGSGATTGNTGATNAAPTAGTPPARPAPIGAETPGPANAGRGTPGAAGQGANEPAGPATAGPGNAPSGQATAGAGTGPAARGTADADDAPAAQATSGPNDQAGAGPASKPTSSIAGQPVSKLTSGVVVQPVNKPTVGAASQPSSKPATGAAGQPASKPSAQATRASLGPASAQDIDDDEPEDTQPVAPGPTRP